MWDKLLMTSWNLEFWPETNWNFCETIFLVYFLFSRLEGSLCVLCDKKKIIKMNSQSQFLYFFHFLIQKYHKPHFQTNMWKKKKIARFAAFLTHFSSDRLKKKFLSILIFNVFVCEKHWRDQHFMGNLFVTVWWGITYLYGMIKGERMFNYSAYKWHHLNKLWFSSNFHEYVGG